jgi:dTDP-4-amino-4,6-dideoxygalactose transaminase
MADSEVIPYVDFSHKNSEIRADLINAFEKVLDSGQYIQGIEVSNFESEFAQYCGRDMRESCVWRFLS